jgi:hypothetical protein
VAYEWPQACHSIIQTVFGPEGHSLPRDAAKPRRIHRPLERCRTNVSPAAHTPLTKIRKFLNARKAASAANLLPRGHLTLVAHVHKHKTEHDSRAGEGKDLSVKNIYVED